MEEPITHPTAVMAKEKGFVFTYEFGFKGKNEDMYINLVSQSVLARWLREKHGICAYIDWLQMRAVICTLFTIRKPSVHILSTWSILIKDNPEIALDELFQEALKLIPAQ